MVEQKRTNTGQGLGIAGLVLGIISIPLAVLGCTFAIALLFGAVGIVLSAIGFSQAKQENGAKGVAIAGLVVSIVGSVIALLWFFFLGAIFQGVHDHKGPWFDKLEKLEEVSRNFEEEIDSGIEDEDMVELEEKMENLEGEIDKKQENDSQKNDEALENAEKMLERLKEEQDRK